MQRKCMRNLFISLLTIASLCSCGSSKHSSSSNSKTFHGHSHASNSKEYPGTAYEESFQTIFLAGRCRDLTDEEMDESAERAEQEYRNSEEFRESQEIVG